jgi:hypothetical protein
METTRTPGVAQAAQVYAWRNKKAVKPGEGAAQHG